MESMLIRERYKIVRILWCQPGYALAEAVDIQDRETPALLLNLYEGEFLHRYGRIYSEVGRADCPEFKGAFLEGDTLVAAFDAQEGEGIDFAFHRGDRWSWQDRLEFAQLVLHQALSMANLPPEISCALLLSDNLLVDVPERRVRVRCMVRPVETDLNPREAALLAADQVKKILPRRLTDTAAEIAFLDLLDAGAFRSVVPLYAAWREALPKIREERGEYDKKNFVSKGIALLKRAFRRRRKKKGERA